MGPMKGPGFVGSYLVGVESRFSVKRLLSLIRRNTKDVNEFLLGNPPYKTEEWSKRNLLISAKYI
jgi:hypothetical protein